MIVRRVASASRRQAAPGGGGTSSPALASSATRDEAVPVADPVALRNRIDALRGAVFAMREIHDALVGRLQVVRQMAGTQPGTEGRSHDFEVNNAIHDSLRLRAEILRMAAERTDGGSASADDDDNDDDIDDLDGAAPPASTAAIAALKRFTKLSVDTTVICPVCQEAPNGTRRWVQLPACRHEYCEECAVQWLSLSRTCPTCRAEVTTPRVIATEHHSFNGDRHPDAVMVPSPQAVVSQSTSRLATLRGLPPATAAEADHHKVRGPIVAPLSSQLHQRLSMLSTPGAPGTPGTLAALRTTPLSRTPSALRPSSAKPLLQAAASNMDDSGLAVMPSRLLTLRRPGSAASRTPQSSMTDAVRRSPPLSSTTTNVAAQRSVSAAGQGLSATLRPSSAVLLRPPSASGTTHRRGGVSPKREAAPSTTTRVDDTAGLLVGARLTLSQRPQSATRPLRVGSASQRPQPAAGIVFSTTTTGRPPRHM